MSNPIPKIKVHLSQEDIEDLQGGEVFDWTFTSDKGEDIDIELYMGDIEEEELIYNDTLIGNE